MPDHGSKPADGRAHEIEAFLDYVIRRDTELRRRIEEKFGVDFETILEMLDGDPIVFAYWKH